MGACDRGLCEFRFLSRFGISRTLLETHDKEYEQKMANTMVTALPQIGIPSDPYSSVASCEIR